MLDLPGSSYIPLPTVVPRELLLTDVTIARGSVVDPSELLFAEGHIDPPNHQLRVILHLMEPGNLLAIESL